MVSDETFSRSNWPVSSEAALAAVPARYPDAFVRYACGCGGRVEVGWPGLLARYGPAATIGDLVVRYRCRWCGRAPYLAQMMDRTMQEIYVVGDGPRRPVVLISDPRAPTR